MNYVDSETSPDCPIFVRGLSRSGGTLLVTILDSHPDISMSYELYPNLLQPEAEEDSLAALADRLQSTLVAKKALQIPKSAGIRKFMAYAARGGISPKIFGELLAEHVAAGMSLDSIQGRNVFVARCAKHKMKREGKQRWGAKCANQFETYAATWPNARFFNMLRDGRDVLASQLNTGSFNPEPVALARSWAKLHQHFSDLVEAGVIQGRSIRYEKLVTDPREAITAICNFLRIEFSEAMLTHETQQLSIYSSKHLSMEQLVRPINSNQIGRWRKDLSSEQSAEFESVAGPVLQKFGYILKDHAD